LTLRGGQRLLVHRTQRRRLDPGSAKEQTVPQKQAFGQTISWEWSHKTSATENDPGGAPFRDGKPDRLFLPILCLYSGERHVRLHSRGFKFVATVDFEDTSDIAKIGFSNTIYSSLRRWYYRPPNESQGGIRLTETIAPLPRWDGAAAEDAPWYGAEEDIEDGMEVYFSDAPNLPPYPDDPEDQQHPFGRRVIVEPDRTGKSRMQSLFFIEGIDTYEALLVVERQDEERVVLDSIPWYVVFEATIEHGRVTPAGRAGTFLNAGNGQGRLIEDGPGSAESKQSRRDNWALRTVSANVQAAARRRA
jgi:hypothetical protein